MFWGGLIWVLYFGSFFSISFSSQRGSSATLEEQWECKSSCFSPFPLAPPVWNTYLHRWSPFDKSFLFFFNQNIDSPGKDLGLQEMCIRHTWGTDVWLRDENFSHCQHVGYHVFFFPCTPWGHRDFIALYGRSCYSAFQSLNKLGWLHSGCVHFLRTFLYVPLRFCPFLQCQWDPRLSYDHYEWCLFFSLFQEIDLWRLTDDESNKLCNL